MAQVTLLRVSIADLHDEEKEILGLGNDFKRLIISERTADYSKALLISTYLRPSVKPSRSYFVYVDDNNILKKTALNQNNASGAMFDITLNAGTKIRKLAYKNGLVPSLVSQVVENINKVPSADTLDDCSQNTPYIKKIGMIIR